ncbi:MAG: hypothetical protein BGP10_00035 [Rhodanobacter sp. 68-29]|nr:MAG: hypothetical protein ABT02_13925 [Comamonadaceae bacterium SCN 68-20]OJY57140.1 MAG: hypothetical protein BGP10_00035 [Rhodanobacter sp. 68-29]
MSREFLIDRDNFVHGFAISLPELIAGFNGRCIVPRKIESEPGMAVVAQIVSPEGTNRRKEDGDAWRRCAIVSQYDIERCHVEGGRADVDQRVQTCPHLRRPQIPGDLSDELRHYTRFYFEVCFTISQGPCSQNILLCESIFRRQQPSGLSDAPKYVDDLGVFVRFRGTTDIQLPAQ